MTTPSLLGELGQVVQEAYRAGFITACKWPEPVTQDVDSSAYNREFNTWSFSVREKHAEIADMAKRLEAANALLHECMAGLAHVGYPESMAMFGGDHRRAENLHDEILKHLQGAGDEAV